MTSPYLDRPQRSPGQAAYDADVAAEPLYVDGKPRKTWDELPDYCKAQWERNPTPRLRARRN